MVPTFLSLFDCAASCSASVSVGGSVIVLRLVEPDTGLLGDSSSAGILFLNADAGCLSV